MVARYSVTFCDNPTCRAKLLSSTDVEVCELCKPLKLRPIHSLPSPSPSPVDSEAEMAIDRPPQSTKKAEKERESRDAIVKGLRKVELAIDRTRVLNLGIPEWERSLSRQNRDKSGLEHPKDEILSISVTAHDAQVREIIRLRNLVDDLIAKQEDVTVKQEDLELEDGQGRRSPSLYREFPRL